MPHSNNESAQIAEALNRLGIAMEQLQERYDAGQRAGRRVRIALIIALLLLGGAAYQLLSPVAEQLSTIPHLITQAFPRLKQPAINTAAEEQKKQQLLEMLSSDERSRIMRFERQQKWLSQYLAVNPDYHPGAAVALHLAQMADSVMVMPKLYEEVKTMNHNIHTITRELQTMNDKMKVMPILAADINEIKFYISIMTRDVNSSMGKAGRIIPW